LTISVNFNINTFKIAEINVHRNNPFILQISNTQVARNYGIKNLELERKKNIIKLLL